MVLAIETLLASFYFSTISFLWQHNPIHSKKLTLHTTSLLLSPSLLISHPYLAKLLNAALWGFIHSGTRPVCSCSAINLCISSVVRQETHKTIVSTNKNRLSHDNTISCSFLTFDLLNRCQFTLPVVVKWLCGRRLKVYNILSHARRCGKTAFAHARMIPQASLVQVWMGQSIDYRYSLVLKQQQQCN